MRDKTSIAARLLPGFVMLVSALAVWELSVRFFAISPILLPSPSAVWAEFWRMPSFFLYNAGVTLAVTLIGFLLAMVFGVLLAIVIVSSKTLERPVFSFLVALNSVPKVALAPLFVVWMGIGPEPKIAIAVMLAIFAIVIDTVLGLRSVDPDMVNLARVGRASKWQILTKIRLPCALPSMFAGLKVAISLALIGAIIGEFVGGSSGLGFAILSAQGQFDTPGLFVSLALLIAMGSLLFNIMEGIERLSIPWHTSVRSH
ncbi:ABC transporter permease (plasmid) [Brucella anthropi]|uniref:Binding-protein-dependent transport systems inner membrane component n=1 Tax=Brucella anthropi (strain ATCC 49188 / DSM 6882 / CCUG 24695 / JCM 21032 / LMG 3331 / NBRC 15819 / NCTC 12168 / Alc 37) TaxID=439375 RepID=A6X7R3_BRUA4|nr:ABC transporter permease subunit [Brucella anthropi]ABS17267.1 binding-protein-dependent transport systems inner membrane component [Brucella anthropi ATCC 49188]QQC26787.1 ABC transporter permease [Brucella anthropi]